MTEEAAAATAAAADAQPVFSIDILGTIKELQAKNGLRHGDYQRYRQFCARKLKRLRKPLDIKYGRGKSFKYRPITEEKVTDVRYLLVPLFSAERAWAYGMQLKSHDLEEEPRVRFHLNRRMKKAALFGKKLEELCATCADTRTALEAEGYAAWLSANNLFEREEWEGALGQFVKARTIYDNLAGTPAQMDLCKQLSEEIYTNMRYCNYKLKGGEDMAQLMEMKHDGNDLLRSKLNDLMAENRKKTAETMSEVSWLGRTVPMKDEKVRLKVVAVQEAEFELRNYDKNDYDGRMALYDALLGRCGDAMQGVRDAVARTKDGKGTEELRALEGYVRAQQLQHTVARNVFLAGDLRSRLGADVPAKRRAKPEDLVQIYSGLLQNLEELTDVVTSHKRDDETVKQMAASESVYKAVRCYWVAEAHKASGAFAEAAALLDRTGALLRLASERLDACASPNKEELAALKQLKTDVRASKAVLHAEAYLAENPAPGDEEAAEGAAETTVLEDPTVYRSGYAPNKTPTIAPFPPSFTPVPCKPVFFDLAGNHVDFPDISERVAKQKTAGSSGWFSGWWK